MGGWLCPGPRRDRGVTGSIPSVGGGPPLAARGSARACRCQVLVGAARVSPRTGSRTPSSQDGRGPVADALEARGAWKRLFGLRCCLRSVLLT